MCLLAWGGSRRLEAFIAILLGCGACLEVRVDGELNFRSVGSLLQISLGCGDCMRLDLRVFMSRLLCPVSLDTLMRSLAAVFLMFVYVSGAFPGSGYGSRGTWHWPA